MGHLSEEPDEPDEPGAPGVPGTWVNANDVVAFVVEVAVVVLLAVAGFATGGSRVTAVLLGVGVPVLAVLLWGAFAAPRARIGNLVLRLVVKVVVLGAGVVAGFVVLPTGWAIAFAAVVVVNLVLMYVGPLARHGAEPMSPADGDRG